MASFNINRYAARLSDEVGRAQAAVRSATAGLPASRRQSAAAERAATFKGAFDSLEREALGEVADCCLEPMGGEARAYVEGARARSNVTPRELDLAAARYGANYQALLALRDIAETRGIEWEGPRSYLDYAADIIPGAVREAYGIAADGTDFGDDAGRAAAMKRLLLNETADMARAVFGRGAARPTEAAPSGAEALGAADA